MFATLEPLEHSSLLTCYLHECEMMHAVEGYVATNTLALTKIEHVNDSCRSRTVSNELGKTRRVLTSRSQESVALCDGNLATQTEVPPQFAVLLHLINGLCKVQTEHVENGMGWCAEVHPSKLKVNLGCVPCMCFCPKEFPTEEGDVDMKHDAWTCTCFAQFKMKQCFGKIVWVFVHVTYWHTCSNHHPCKQSCITHVSHV